MATTIQTNNVPRYTLGWHNLTAKEQAEFDYLDTNDRRYEASFVRYRGVVYDLGEFMRVESGYGGSSGNGALHGWDGYHADSYFSAVLVRYVGDDMESVIMGTACS